MPRLPSLGYAPPSTPPPQAPGDLPFSPTGWSRKGVRNATVLTDAQGPAPGPDETDNWAWNLSKLARAWYNPAESPPQPYVGGSSPGYWMSLGSTTSIYVIPTPDHPRVPVFMYGSAPYGNAPPYYPTAWTEGATYNPPNNYQWPNGVQAVLTDVPVPMGPDYTTPFEVSYGHSIAKECLPAFSCDHNVTIWDPWHDEMWEILYFQTNNVGHRSTYGTVAQAWWDNGTPYLLPPGYPSPADGYFYSCYTGGHITNVSAKGPVFDQTTDGIWGPTGAAIASLGGVVTYEDLLRPSGIGHALNFVVAASIGHIAPATNDDAQLPWGRTYLYTAESGYTAEARHNLPPGYPPYYAIPEGSIFRFPPNWTIPAVGTKITDHPELTTDVVTYSNQNPNRLVNDIDHKMWTAMRDYGFFCMDMAFGNSGFIDFGAALGTQYSPGGIHWGGGGPLDASLWIPADMFPGDAWATAPWQLVQQVNYPF